MSHPRVYLAGLDVFYKNPKELVKVTKAVCEEFDLEGIFPLDVVLDDIKAPHVMAAQIFMANVRLINSCQAVLANMEPFRGPSMDVGTAWEMGYAYARQLPVVGYCTNLMTYKERVTSYKCEDNHDVEDFGLIDNLMLTVSARVFTSMPEAVKHLANHLRRGA